MSARKLVDGLVHEYAGIGSDKFFQMIDSLGGWPVGYKYAGFEHTEERKAGFTNSPDNSGWWTIVASADDYFMWKLSPDALQRIVDAAIDAARITRPNAQVMWLKDSRGRKAAIAKLEQS